MRGYHTKTERGDGSLQGGRRWGCWGEAGDDEVSENEAVELLGLVVVWQASDASSQGAWHAAAGRRSSVLAEVSGKQMERVGPRMSPLLQLLAMATALTRRPHHREILAERFSNLSCLPRLTTRGPLMAPAQVAISPAHFSSETYETRRQ